MAHVDLKVRRVSTEADRRARQIETSALQSMDLIDADAGWCGPFPVLERLLEEPFLDNDIGRNLEDSTQSSIRLMADGVRSSARKWRMDRRVPLTTSCEIREIPPFLSGLAGLRRQDLPYAGHAQHPDRCRRQSRTRVARRLRRSQILDRRRNRCMVARKAEGEARRGKFGLTPFRNELRTLFSQLKGGLVTQLPGDNPKRRFSERSVGLLRAFV